MRIVESFRKLLILCICIVADLMALAMDRCPKCDAALMRGTRHTCSNRALKRKKEKEYKAKIEEFKKQEKKYYYDPNPVELRELDKPSKEYIISDELRVWKNRRGTEVMAAWWHVNSDESVVYLMPANQKMINMPVSRLDDECVEFVTNTIARWKAENKKWYLGVYMGDGEINRVRYINKAKALIKSYDKMIQRVSVVKTTKADRQGAFAFAGELDEFGRFKKILSDEVFYISTKHENVADNTIVRANRFYWAGVTSYVLTRRYYNAYQGSVLSKSDHKMNCIASDLMTAVHNVRLSHNLYDADDSEFVVSGEMGGKGQSGSVHAEDIKLHSTGSGFLITEDGYIITNHHVIDGARKIEVHVQSGDCYETFEAKVVGKDAATDLALLKITGKEKFRCLCMSPMRTEDVGAEVIAAGYPQTNLQGNTLKATTGIISGTEGFQGAPSEYQISAAVQPGNSGGPLCDMQGNVIGVIVASLKRGQMVNFAIKKTYVLAFVDAFSGCARNIQTGQIVSKDNRTTLKDTIKKISPSCVWIKNFQ